MVPRLGLSSYLAGVLDTAPAPALQDACSSDLPYTHTQEGAAQWQRVFSRRSRRSSFPSGSRLRLYRLLFTEVLTKALDYVEGDRNEEDRQYGGCEHAADDDGA